MEQEFTKEELLQMKEFYEYKIEADEAYLNELKQTLAEINQAITTKHD